MRSAIGDDVFALRSICKFAARMSSPDASIIESLRRWSQILLWVSIVLPFLGALAAGARYYVERYEKRLTSRITAAAIERAHSDAAAARAEAGDAKRAQGSLQQELAATRLELDAKTRPYALNDNERARLEQLFATLPRGTPLEIVTPIHRQRLTEPSELFATQVADILTALHFTVTVVQQVEVPQHGIRLEGFSPVANSPSDMQLMQGLIDAFARAGVPLSSSLQSGPSYDREVIRIVIGLNPLQ